MSDASNPVVTTPAPATVTPTSTPQVVVVRERDSEVKDYRNMSQDQFTQRLEEERDRGARAILKELGIEKKDRKAALQEIRDGRMSLTKREQEVVEARASADALKPQAERAAVLEAELKAYADEQYASLPESVQKYIAEIIPEDPAARLKAIRAARSSGLLNPSKPEKAVVPSTTMADSGPTAPKPAGTLNHWEKWQELRNNGQRVAAANYYNLWAASIDKQRPSK